MDTAINVTTLPNGYAMSIGKEEYMYFSKEDLLRGMMFHVGLCELEFVDKLTADEFLASSVLWKDNKRTIKELMKLQKENDLLKRSLKAQKEVVARLKKKVDKIQD